MALGALAQSADTSESPPLWEYGVGVGALRYWHYPAAGQFRDIAVAFPTFKYRGEILRADDREGARAYLLRQDIWSLELGGGGLPSVSTEENEAREGMDAIPWGVQLGPQIVIEPLPEWQIKIGIYQAVTTDFKMTKTNGVLSEAKLLWKIDDRVARAKIFGDAQVKTQLGFTVQGSSQEFAATYFEVERRDATAARPEYAAKAGFLGYEFSLFQSVTVERTTFYCGLSDAHYDFSVNKDSPLHKQNENLAIFLGLTYTLSESKKASTPEDEARGLLNRRSQ